MFPYDPQHRTFLNFYEGDALTQAIVDKDRNRFEYFTGTRQGVWEVLQKFVPSGVHHILIGPDHLLFLVGLLLLGGSLKQLLLVVTAFTAAHSITLSLAALGMVIPPTSIVEPAIALSVIYVGADNLLVGSGRDTRAWIAFAFGLIHGFGFANVLREMDLPSSSAWLDALRVQRRRRTGPARRGCGGRVGACVDTIAKSRDRDTFGVRRLHHRDADRCVLVRGAGFLFWRRGMRHVTFDDIT